MRLEKRFYLIVLFFVFFCVFFVRPSISEEPSQKGAAFEQNKAEILKNLDVFEHSLKATKSCMSAAKTSDEFNKCQVDEATMKFQKVQDMLSEMGMSWEERKLKRAGH